MITFPFILNVHSLIFMISSAEETYNYVIHQLIWRSVIVGGGSSYFRRQWSHITLRPVETGVILQAREPWKRLYKMEMLIIKLAFGISPRCPEAHLFPMKPKYSFYPNWKVVNEEILQVFRLSCCTHVFVSKKLRHCPKESNC